MKETKESLGAGNVPGAGRASGWREAGLAALLLGLALALAYGPAKFAGHSLYSGVIQDLTNLYGFYAWDMFTRAEFAAGRFPLWNPHNAFGIPHLANMQTAPFYPLNLIKWAFGFWPVIDGLLLARLFLAGFFTWLFARQALRLSFWAALIAGVAFMLSGYLTRFIYMSHLNVETLLPMQLWLMWRLLDRRRLRDVALAGAGFAALILGGFPEATLWAFAFALAYYLAAGGWRFAGLLRAGAALIVGLVLSLPQWLPFAEYYPHVWTYHEAASGLRHYNIGHAIAMVLPWFFGENRLSPVAAFLPPYVGAVGAALAVAAILGIRRASRPQIFFAAALVALLGVAFGLPPFNLIGYVFPFSLTYNDKYTAPAVALCVALLSGAGLDRLSSEKHRTGLIATGALLVFIGANVAAGYLNAFAPVWALGLLDPFMALAAVMLLGTLMALTWMRSRDLVSAKGFGRAAAALVLLGLLYDQQGQTPAWRDTFPVEAERRSRTLPSGAEVRVHAEPELDEVFPNRLLPSGVDDIRSYDPLYPQSYVDFMAEVDGLAGDTLLRHYNQNMLFVVDPSRRSDPLLDLASLSVLILPAPIEEKPMVREWLMSGVTRGPRHESWLRAEDVIAGGVLGPALIEHAPVRVTMDDERLEPTGKDRAELRFSTAVPDNQVGGSGDGVFFSLYRGRGLAFARYLDPKARPEERGFKNYTAIWGKGTPAFTLLPGPRNDLDRDVGAIGNPRIWEDRQDEKFRRLGQGPNGPWLYTRESAYPRAWMVKDRHAPIEVTELQAARQLLDNNPLAMHGMFLTTWKNKIVFAPTGETADRNELKFLPHSSGRLAVSYSRVDTDGFIVFAEQRLPGWRAFVKSKNGEVEAPVIPANGPFMAVPAAKGVGSVEVLYQPFGFRIGLWAGLTGLAFILFSMFVLRPRFPCLD